MAGLIMLSLSHSPAGATPDHRVNVDEQFLGSNETGFASLRTETDNLASYYAYRTKRYLDEYEKRGDAKTGDLNIAVRTRSTLLLDVTTSIDPNHNDNRTPPARTAKVNAKDDSMALADIFVQYPARCEKWDAERFTKLTTNLTGGVRVGNLNLVSGDTIKRIVFAHPDPDVNWALDEVTQDSNCVYLRVSCIDGDEAQQTRWICLVPRLTRQLEDHLILAPFYMSAGSYPTEKEAMDKAVDLLIKDRENNQQPIGPAIWTMWKNTGKMVYVVVVCDMPEAGKEDSFIALEKRLGVHLVPQSSAQFEERIPVVEPPAPRAPDTPPKQD